MKAILLSIICFLIVQLSSAQIPQEVFLWNGNAPGSEGKTGPEHVRIYEPTGDHVVTNIHRPSITPFIPASGKATGTAIIIAPGGGHAELWIDHEGYAPARWLSDHGVTAFVLKYRLAREPNSSYKVEVDALADIQRAIRLVRSRAKEWGIDTARIGVMGFSAGGEVAALSAMHPVKGNSAAQDAVEREKARPSFQALVYPGNIKSYEVSKDSPPVFLLGGYQDRPDIAEGLATIYLKYKQAGVPAELHIYSNVGHGFGLRKANTGVTSNWPQRLLEWLDEIGMNGK